MDNTANENYPVQEESQGGPSNSSRGNSSGQNSSQGNSGTGAVPPGVNRSSTGRFTSERGGSYGGPSYSGESFQGGQAGQQSGMQGQSPINFIMVPTPGGEGQENSMNCNHPTILPVPIGGLGGYGYGAAAPVAPAYGGLSGDFYSYQAALMASENACKAAENVKDSEADIKDSIQILSNNLDAKNLVLLQKVCDNEKAAIENRAILLASTKEDKNQLQMQIAECCCDMKTQNLELKQFITDKFCDVEKTRLNDEIAELRQEKADGVNNGILSTLNAILGKLK